jgi:hypothetical protein
MQRIIEQLQKIRQRSRIMLLAQGLSRGVTWALVIGLVLIMADFLLRLPSAMRLVLLIAGLAVLSWWVWTALRNALGFAPSLTELALRVERRIPSVAGRLASSVEFAIAGLDRENPLAARSVRDAESRMTGQDVQTVIDSSSMWKRIGVAGLVAAIVSTIIIVQPVGAVTGIKRLFIPYGATQWPARTAVKSLMSEVVREGNVHPRGQALLLRAQNLTRNGEGEDVNAMYRLEHTGTMTPWQRIVLTHQGDGVHERLVDTDADAIEVRFATADAQTMDERILLVPPPAIVRSFITITPPAYASGRYPAIEAELGPGVDDRAATPTAALAGSVARFTMILNKELPVPDAGEAREEWVMRTFEGMAPVMPTLALGPSSEAETVWELAWVIPDTQTITVQLVDEYGLSNDETISYRVLAVGDVLPTVTIIDPDADDIVLPTAVVPLVAEARDDVGLSRLALEAAVATADVPNEDPATEQPVDAVDWATEQSVDDQTSLLSADLDLGELGVHEGDIVMVTAVAQDIFELDGEQHDAARSPVRRLRVISEVDFATQMRRQLGGVRQNAIRIEALQSELQDDIVDAGVQPGVGRAQAQIAERIAAQREMLDEINDRINVNNLDDDQLRELLNQSGSLLDFAGRAADSATRAIEQRQREAGSEPPTEAQDNQAEPNEPSEGADETPGERSADGPSAGREGERSSAGQSTSEAPAGEPGTQGEAQAGGEGGNQPASPASEDEWLDEADLPQEAAPEDQGIVEAQQDVREELADLIELLDRDEDTWVVTRQLEELQEEQGRLQAETARLGQRTLGQSLDELSPEDAEALAELAETQRELGERVDQLTDELRDRAESLEEVDPESASGMRRAASTAEQRGLGRDMQQASERVESNQSRAAQESQASARQTIERMLEDIEESRRAQADELLRRLASLVESIERLIVVQENEISSLARAVDEESFTGRDRAMIRLNQNTVGVASEARAAGSLARRIARLLDRAADAQGAAVSALRARPINTDLALESEERSLEQLTEAKSLAEELEEETQEDEMNRLREEIQEAYRAFIERQIALREETLALAEHDELSRRQLMDARRLGVSENELRREITELRDTTREILDSVVFSHTHDLIDSRAQDAADALGNGDVSVDVSDGQMLIADSLRRLMEALEDEDSPPNEFAEESDMGGGGGGQSQPPLIPPVKELKLLRGLQEQVYNQTKALDSRNDLTDGQLRERLRTIGLHQRELLDLGSEMLERFASQESATPTPTVPREGGSSDEDGDADDASDSGDTGMSPDRGRNTTPPQPPTTGDGR